MLRELTLLVSALAIVCVYVCASPHMLSVPFLVWSPMGEEHQMTQQQAKSSYEVDIFVGRMLASRPEVVLAFVNPELSSDEFAQSDLPQSRFFHSLLASAQSQVVFPYVFTTAGLTDGVARVIRQANPSSVVIKLDAASSCEAQIQSLAELDIYDNRNVDLIIASWDASSPVTCMSQIVNEVANRSNQKYMGIVTSDHAAAIRTSFSSGDRSVASLLEMRSNARLQAVKPANPYYLNKGVQFISPTILFALMFGFLFLLMLVCGVNCLNSVQTPLRYSATKMTVPKEY